MLKQIKIIEKLVELNKKIKLDKEKNMDKVSIEKNDYIANHVSEGNDSIFGYGHIKHFRLYAKLKLTEKKTKPFKKPFKRYVLGCFLVYCLCLIFCYDAFDDGQFFFLYEFHKWW